MIEVDSELSEMLSTAYEERRKLRNDGKNKAHEEQIEAVNSRKRKLERVKRLKMKHAQNTGDTFEIPKNYQLTRAERQRDLQTIDIMRER
jgi:hypothetical protein